MNRTRALVIAAAVVAAGPLLSQMPSHAKSMGEALAADAARRAKIQAGIDKALGASVERQVYTQTLQAEFRAEADSKKQVPNVSGIAALQQRSKLHAQLFEQYKKPILAKYHLTPEQLTVLMQTGSDKKWPRPAR